MYQIFLLGESQNIALKILLWTSAVSLIPFAQSDLFNNISKKSFTFCLSRLSLTYESQNDALSPTSMFFLSRPYSSISTRISLVSAGLMENSIWGWNGKVSRKLRMVQWKPGRNSTLSTFSEPRYPFAMILLFRVQLSFSKRCGKPQGESLSGRSLALLSIPTNFQKSPAQLNFIRGHLISSIKDNAET